MSADTNMGWPVKAVWAVALILFVAQAAVLLRMAAPPPSPRAASKPSARYMAPMNAEMLLAPWVERQGPEAIYEMQMAGLRTFSLAEAYRFPDVAVSPPLLGVGNMPARIGLPPAIPRAESAPADSPVSLLVPERVAVGELGRGSFVRVVFPAGERALTGPLQVPDPGGAELQEPTVIEVAVLPDGYVFLATLRKSSNSRELDERALRVAKTARFTPTSTATNDLRPAQDKYELEWGQLVFTWSAFREPPVPSAR